MSLRQAIFFDERTFLQLSCLNSYVLIFDNCPDL